MPRKLDAYVPGCSWQSASNIVELIENLDREYQKQPVKKAVPPADDFDIDLPF